MTGSSSTGPRSSPTPAQAANLDGPRDGCVRGIEPCAPYAGLREQLAAIRSQQRASPGSWQVLVVIYGVPDWAARPASGCERPQAAPFSRPITRAGLAAYRALIAEILALGRQEHVALRWWAPWNEPNHPAFVSPQRTRCDETSPLVAAGAYAGLVRSMRAVLAADGADHALVMGELAGFTAAKPYSTTAAQFVAALPQDVACAGAVWSVHEYARSALPGGQDPVGGLQRALDARRCTRGMHLWVDETGAGNLPGRPDPSRAVACGALVADVDRWAADPRIDVAIQYTFRDDPLFPVGLADAQLTHLWPSYGVWAALTAGRVPTPGDCAQGGRTP